jgi:hypothetical protein
VRIREQDNYTGNTVGVIDPTTNKVVRIIDTFCGRIAIGYLEHLHTFP